MASDSESPTPVEEVVETVSEWPELAVGTHRFNAVEFLLEDYEVGHIHRDSGTLDINFPGGCGTR